MRRSRSELEHGNSEDAIPSSTGSTDRTLIPAWWLLIAGAAAFGIAAWLKSFSFSVLLVSFAAAVLGAMMIRPARVGGAGWFAMGVLGLTLGIAATYQWRLTRIERDWDQHSARVARVGSLILQEAARREVEILDSIAHRALSAPTEEESAF